MYVHVVCIISCMVCIVSVWSVAVWHIA